MGYVHGTGSTLEVTCTGTIPVAVGYRVSRCTVCWRSQRQYFLSWMRSRSFCLFFMVM